MGMDASTEVPCANCGVLQDSGRGWEGHPLCIECSRHPRGLLRFYHSRAEMLAWQLRDATKERGEARALCIRAVHIQRTAGARPGAPSWGVEDPHGRALGYDGWGQGVPIRFHTKEEALAAGRALPWWEVKP